MPQEIERRFLVKTLNSRELFEKAEKTYIEQGYFELPASFQHLRFRIIDSEKAVITSKSGSGMVRQELETPIDVSAARFMLENCWYVIKKTRYTYEGWEIDFFEDPLSNVVIAEYEMSSPEEEVHLPSWIYEAVEVTDSLTNLHLARFASDLKNAGVYNAALHQDLLKDTGIVPRIVLTGGPCSGKSTLIKALTDRLGDELHCVPEVATILIANVGIDPPVGDPLSMARFQQTIAKLQKTFEATSAEHTRRNNKQAMVLDRGIVDNAAYLPGKTEEMERLFNTTKEYEYSRYDLVLCMETPPRDVYEENSANNPARHETYDQAVELGHAIKEVWSGHPNFHVIDGDHWEDKEANAFEIINKFFQ